MSQGCSKPSPLTVDTWKVREQGGAALSPIVPFDQPSHFWTCPIGDLSFVNLNREIECWKQGRDISPYLGSGSIERLPHVIHLPILYERVEKNGSRWVLAHWIQTQPIPEWYFDDDDLPRERTLEQALSDCSKWQILIPPRLIGTAKAIKEGDLPDVLAQVTEPDAKSWLGGTESVGRSVVLGEPDEQPIVNGKIEPKLTKKRYKVVKALYDAGNDGLSGDELTRKSSGGAVTILKNLARSNPDWESVIVLPGRPHGRYRIRQSDGSRKN